MLASLVTIVIPCNNSVAELKSTLNSILDQTMIKGTRVLILDTGSNDGSIQYAAQVSFDLYRKLTIESIEIKENISNNLNSQIITPYTLWISPGSILDSKDFILDSINSANTGNDIYVYPNKGQGILKDIFSNYYLKRDEITISCIFCKNKISKNIGYKKINGIFQIFIPKNNLNKNYRIIKGKTSFPKISK